jgi:hypothetical protein
MKAGISLSPACGERVASEASRVRGYFDALRIVGTPLHPPDFADASAGDLSPHAGRGEKPYSFAGTVCR